MLFIGLLSASKRYVQILINMNSYEYILDEPKPLRVAPKDTAVIAGQDVRFNCSSDYFKKVWWRKSPVGSITADDIYMGYGGLVGVYRSGGRHSVDADDVTGNYNLLIRNVQRGDAGRYVCVDKSGLGTIGGAELIVLGKSVTSSYTYWIFICAWTPNLNS